MAVQAQVIKDPNQPRTIQDINKSENDSILERDVNQKPADSLKIFNPRITDYQLRSAYQPYKTVDTALTIDAFYKQNYYRQDLFLYQDPPNIGLTLNPLSIETNAHPLEILPTGLAYRYKAVDSIQYFNVKTPLTQLIFENGVQEGQFLSTTFSHNIHARWNYAINYDYLSSLGRYVNTEAKNTIFSVNTHYQTSNNRYQIQAAFVAHDLNNNENAGITPTSLQAYIDNDANFTNRENMFPNLQGATTKFDERRLQMQQKFGVISFHKKDSLTDSRDFPIFLKHTLVYKHQNYRYSETAGNPQYYFDSILIGDNLYNRKKLDNLSNKVTLGYQWSKRLNVEGGVMHQLVKAYYENPQVYAQGTIPADIVDNRLGITANLEFRWKEHIKISADGEMTQGDELGNAYYLNTNLTFALSNALKLQGGLRLQGSPAPINFMYHQSFYDNFNYYHEDLSQVTTQEINAAIAYEPLGLQAYTKLQNINHYTYWDANYSVQQLEDPLQYFAVGVRDHYTFSNFGVDANLQYQKVIDNHSIYPLPDFIARATMYYQNTAYHKNLNFMAGLSVHYFSTFDSREFLPIVNEFSLQESTNQRSIGNYPQLDAFFNMKVRRMRIYIRGENLNSFIMPGENLFTPNQPSRDFKIQLGIHWFLFS